MQYLVRRRAVGDLTVKNHRLRLHHFHRSATPLLYLKNLKPPHQKFISFLSHSSKNTLKDSNFNSLPATAMCFSADFCALADDCVAKIISLTSPPDACRMALVSNFFKSMAESDAVWEKFLPSDYQEVVARSDSAANCQLEQLMGLSKKEMFFRLSEFPLLIDSGLKSFFLDKWTGKKCYMISARDLDIVWGDTPSYWQWMPLPESRFPEVAELRSVCWLEIHGKIESSLLSTETNYAVYLVFKFNEGAYGFDYQPAEVSVGISGGKTCTKSVYLDCAEVGKPRRLRIVPRRVALFSRTHAHIRAQQAPAPARERPNPAPKQRRDGWLEIELGVYFIHGGEVGALEMSLSEVKGGHWKAGLIVQGIEVRPKPVSSKYDM